MPSGGTAPADGPRAPLRLNSCSGEVCPRGPSLRRDASLACIGVSILVLVKYALGGAALIRPTSTSTSLNSCSGEVCPRGRANGASRWQPQRVSILVLVKYALGAGGPVGKVAPLRPDGSILVLVKYAPGDGRLVARKRGLDMCLNSCSGEVCPRGTEILIRVRARPPRSQFLFW